VHLICDNFSTHKSPTITTWLGVHPRFHMHFTRTYSSWFNQVVRRVYPMIGSSPVKSILVWGCMVLAGGSGK
jgi:hypothetical protein